MWLKILSKTVSRCFASCLMSCARVGYAETMCLKGDFSIKFAHSCTVTGGSTYSPTDTKLSSKPNTWS